MKRRTKRHMYTPGFSVLLFSAAAALVFWYPFEKTEELRDESPSPAETMQTEEVTLGGARIVEGRTLIPFRAVFEELEADVNWNNETKTVTASRGGTTLELTIDSSEALIDGRETTLDTPPVIFASSTFVPLRFVSEAFGADVEWRSDTKEAVVEDEGKIITVRTEMEGNIVRTQTGPRITTGMTEEEVTSGWGEPETVSPSPYDFDWETYHDNYEDFRMVGMEDGRVTALYTNEEDYLPFEELSLGMTSDEVQGVFGEPVTEIRKGNTRYTQQLNEEYDLFETDAGYLTVFYDVHRQGKATAVQLIDGETETALNGYYGTASAGRESGYAEQLFDLVNADRVKFGRDPLDWNQEVAAVAAMHSADMAANHYFSHDNLEGQNPFDRMKDAGLRYTRAGENIASGQPGAVHAQQGLMNSWGHRRNILSEEYTELGTGVRFAEDNRPYFTQNFYTP
ncbi:CAP-associated domain-containing protein [Alkalicoccus urumqiensis]|uniref:Serine protease n=1 Tax=Alkalicoccus urumqiensis TaxID=1548213 RepID=A0A2P6ML44_ALKUR|nr:CAP-associated domain-containing protein [Alkalicoccus urumqiensis]PRO66999.1 serine protease [Alkalicoccus urumqiensis]